MLPALPFEKLFEDAQIPTRAHEGDAGLDLYAYLPRDRQNWGLTLEPSERTHVGTGVRVAIPEGFVGLVCPRSGLAFTSGITVLNAPGVVDSGYRGELGVLLVNTDIIRHTFAHGDRIAQLLVVPIATPAPIETLHVNEYFPSTRGEGGFGSSGQ